MKHDDINWGHGNDDYLRYEKILTNLLRFGHTSFVFNHKVDLIVYMTAIEAGIISYDRDTDMWIPNYTADTIRQCAIEIDKLITISDLMES